MSRGLDSPKYRVFQAERTESPKAGKLKAEIPEMAGPLASDLTQPCGICSD